MPLDAPDDAALQALAQRLEALPCNRPGADKRWVLEALARALAFRRAQRRARRVPAR
jgi:hypothetical protein